MHIEVACTISPVIVYIASWTSCTESTLRDDNEVRGAQCCPGAPICCTICTGCNGVRISTPHVVADHGVLDAAVPSLLLDTVLVVLGSELLSTSKIVALDCACSQNMSAMTAKYVPPDARTRRQVPVIPVWYWKQPCCDATVGSLQLYWVTFTHRGLLSLTCIWAGWRAPLFSTGL